MIIKIFVKLWIKKVNEFEQIVKHKFIFVGIDT